MIYSGADFSDSVDDTEIRDAFDHALGSKSGTSSGEDLPIVWFSDVEANLNNLWLIKGLLPRTGIALTYGHPGSGKSFLAIDMSLHIALGWKWHGLTTEQGLVIYVGAEGLSGLKNRMAAFRSHYQLSTPIPFALIPTPIDMQSPTADTGRLIAAIKRACEESGYEPRLVVIDTLSKTFGIGKENGEDMITYVANCEKVAATFGCCVMPVHHRPKDAESKEPRGHSSLKGGVDTVLLVEAGTTKKATVFKQKDGEDGAVFLFNLLPVALGIDNDGDIVTSCIVEHSLVDNSLPTDPKAFARKKLTDAQRQVFSELGKCLEHHGQSVPTEIPDSHISRLMTTKVVKRDAWRDTYLAVACHDRDNQDTNRDSERRGFNRTVTKLQNVGLIGVWEDFAWLA